MEGSIISTQDPILNQGKVEVYSFHVPVAIPTIHQTTRWMLHEILGNEAGPIIVSPNGGRVEDHYFKPVSKLRTDTGRAGGYSGKEGTPEYSKHTDEDSVRFWITESRGFVGELVEAGWMHFPAIEEIQEYEKARMGLSSQSKIFGRGIPIKNLIRIIETTDNDGVNYQKQLADLREVSQFGDHAQLAYGGMAVPLLSMSVSFEGMNLALNLSDFEESLRREDPNVYMKRRTFFEVGFGRDYLEDASRRITELTRSYVDQNGMGAYINQKNEGEGISVTLEKKTEDLGVPDTRKLLSEAVRLKEFILRAASLEEESYTAEQNRLLSLRKSQLGLKQ